MILAAAIWPLLRAYAAHAGVPVPEDKLRAQLRRRLSFFPLWARLYLAASALFVLLIGPLMTVGRLSSFAGLAAEDREKCLTSLQRDGRIYIRPMFLGVKSLLLACCYGTPEFLATIGYKTRSAAHV